MDLDLDKMTIVQMKERAKDVELSAKKAGNDSFQVF